MLLSPLVFDIDDFVVKYKHSYINNVLTDLVDVIYSNQDIFYDVLVHGSYVTNDYVLGWSDLDALVVLKDDAVISAKNLTATRLVIKDCIKYLRKIDPLCHHEFQVVMQSDLDSFPVHLLPQSVFEISQSILKRKHMKVIFRNTINNASQVILSFRDVLKNAFVTGYLEHHPWQGEYLLDDFKNRDNGMYQIKYLLSVLVLMPALYYTAQGVSKTKPDAIKNAKDEFQDIDWEIIDKATDIRLAWSQYEHYPYNGNAIPSWLVEILGYDYFKRSYGFLNSLSKKLSIRENCEI